MQYILDRLIESEKLTAEEEPVLRQGATPEEEDDFRVRHTFSIRALHDRRCFSLDREGHKLLYPGDRTFIFGVVTVTGGSKTLINPKGVALPREKAVKRALVSDSFENEHMHAPLTSLTHASIQPFIFIYYGFACGNFRNKSMLGRIWWKSTTSMLEVCRILWNVFFILMMETHPHHARWRMGFLIHKLLSDVTGKQELDTIIPIVQDILKVRPEAYIGVATFRASVAKAAVEAGARLVNDVSGGQQLQSFHGFSCSIIELLESSSWPLSLSLSLSGCQW